MKKTLALLLAMLMAFTGLAACAEGLPYLRQLPQYTYVRTSFLTPESYPRVCICPFYAGSMYEYGDKQPMFITFDAPEGFSPVEFELDECNFINEDTREQYSYQALEDSAYETLLNKCENEDYIIYDGENKVAAYIDPDKLRAYGMLGVKEIARGAKLYMTLYLGALSERMPLDKRVTELTNAITAEIERVQAGMAVETIEPHWAYGRFQGAKLLSQELPGLMLKLDFQNIQATDANGGKVTGDMIPMQVDANRFKGYVFYGDKQTAEVEITTETYSYLNYIKEQQPDEALTITTSDGNTWDLYMNALDDFGYTTLCYCSLPISDTAGYDGKQVCYLNINLEGNNIKWFSKEDVTETLNSILANLTLMNADDDPYTGPEETTTEVTEGPAEGTGSQAGAASDSPAATLVGTVITLLQADPATNGAAASVLLGNIATLVADNAAASAIVTSAKALLDADPAANGAVAITLLEQVKGML